MEYNSETSEHPFELLKPDYILDAIESQDLVCDGRIMALNSYENRVYQVGIDEQEPIIAKFYRPGRWSNTQIREEHQFCAQLFMHELPVVPPLQNNDGESLHQHGPFRFALYERKGGHAPELDCMEHLNMIGRCLGRIHRVSSVEPFDYRPTIDIQSFGHDSFTYIQQYFIPDALQAAYTSLCEHLLSALQNRLQEHSGYRTIRVHGDCHPGNLLWRNDAPHFIDFDDARMAPAIQDIWMLLSGNLDQQKIQLETILDGYEQFHSFNHQELELVEVFRTLRIMYFSAWLARRWSDPAFPLGFPWFNTARYWEEHILTLREQLAALQEPCQLL